MFEAKQKVCVSCGNVVFTEATGTYHIDDNPTGYGSPNPDYGDITPYTAEFTPPGATAPVYTLDLLESPPAPDADGHYTWTLTPEAFGADKLKSGIWTVKVTLGTVTTDHAVLIYDDIEQRVADCICSDPCKVDLWAQLQSAKMLFGCFRNEAAQKMIDRLYKETECCCGCGK